MPPLPNVLGPAPLMAPIKVLKQQQQQASVKKAFEIIDIRDPAHPIGDLREQILQSLAKPEEKKNIPTLVLYDEKGLQLFDEITYLEEYYLTNAEIDILERKAEEIVAFVKDGGILVELGAGSLRKTSLLLRALEKHRRNLTYYALDLERSELEKSLSSLGTFTNIALRGLFGTYDDGARWLRSTTRHSADAQRCVLWLGSSIGNLTRPDAAAFLATFKTESLRVGDLMLVGIDRRNESERVRLAYDDTKGVTRDFIMNGLDHVNRIVGGKNSTQTFIERSNFVYDAGYNEEEGRHEAFYCSKADQKLRNPATGESIDIKQGERIHIEFSYKYSSHEVETLADETGLYRVASWPDSQQEYDLHLFQKPPFHFSATQPTRAVPSLDEWKSLWAAWDTVTMGMITPVMRHEKPISLRHPFIFYFGHIPAFLDIQLSRHLGQPYTKPAHFAEIFERGIDPDVEDPTRCHPHSAVPSVKEDWPSVDEILAFRDRVRLRLSNLLSRPVDRRMGRVIWMAFEHEAMHLETVFYMLVQSPNVQPPPGFAPPLWALRRDGLLPQDCEQTVQLNAVKPTPILDVPAGCVTLGHDDIEHKDTTDPLPPAYGWDNESPRRVIPHVPAFKIQSHPVTNLQFLAYLIQINAATEAYPASWICLDNDDDSYGTWAVRTVFGPAPILGSEAAFWPAQISGDQLQEYAASLGGRIPTEAEVHLARERLSTHESKHANHSLRAWHPTSVAPPSTTSLSFSFCSDLWEWTSTPFLRHKGFVPSVLYPGYSADFFDDKHYVILGAAWPTHPRIAERNTFRNWYQKPYAYVFAGGRVAWDAIVDGK